MFRKLTFLMALILVSGIISSSQGTTPQISSVSGTVAQGNTITISGSNMMDEDTTDWDVFFSNNPNASSFEGTSPSADGYSAIGPSDGTYVTDVKVLGSKSIKFHVEGASSNCPYGNLTSYNAINPEGGDTGDLYYRVYARWNTEDDSWPTSHIKMLDCQGSGAQYYFQPANGSVRPSYMNAAYDGANHNYAIPSGQLENDRWYAMEVRWKSTSPYAFDAWVDGTQIADDSPTNPGSLNYLLFGVINCCGTTSNFSLDHWMDGLAVSTSRIYPAAIVEIGDSSNYSTATKLHQEPLFISDSSIQVKADLTDLGSGPYYLWVTNNKQERSSYYQLQTDQATNPSPADSAADVDVDANLSWTAGSSATSHDVYFGTDSTPDSGELQGNQTATTFEPGTMSNSTTYYWRIDEVDSGGTTTGSVWSFTTESAASPPGQATNPSPANSATNVSITADLSWTAGSGATSHDVYFGTSSPGTSQGNQTATTFDTGTMSNNTTYYWRIDEVNVAGTTTGTVWSFTTIVAAPSQASNPSPANSATNVSITADLSWTAGSGATSHDVYFGTSSPGSSQGNQTATTFDPGTMSNDTTYYWRIDEVNAAGTTTGTVWSFTTIVAAPGQASNPSPADSAANVSVDTDLSWTAGSGATSHDVYFGTSSPGTFQGNQTAATFDTGTMDNDTTYYWRIDEVNAGGTTTGTVWSFTTITSGQPVTVEFGDATDTNHPGTVEDTFTNSGSGGDNYSTSALLSVYTWPADTVANTTIIKWDLSAIPTDATVTEATLYLYQTESGGDTSYDVPVHKIINVDPNITTCTWNTYDGTNSWTGGSDGGQSDTAAAEDTPSVNSTNNEYKTWSVTNMVQAWVSTPSANYGMLVNSDDVASVDSYRYFASTEDSNAPYRPKLIVTYIGGTPGQATSPDPNDSATDVTVDAVLSWTAGSGATSHDVYFGTSSPGSFQGNQTETSFDPGTLSYDITYYWRIDEINAAGTTTGNVWTFTTEEAPQPPGQATNPGPADTATNVDVDADLSWTEGTNSTSSDVYFGASSPGSFQGNQTATTFEPGTMSNDTTYYWRIDEVGLGGTTTGNVWSFTTIVAAPGQASNPSPTDSATDVDTDTDLSWTAGSGATSHDVYFGTTSPGAFQGNQTAATFEPGTMSNDTTYYWRIDEVNVGGTTTGNVWNFTTIVAAPSQASSPSPADSATDVNTGADLSWTAGSGSTSSDVYFGTTSPGTFQGNQTAVTFDPGTMSNDTTYYWRIDEVNAGGTTTGNVWSFTTEAAAGPVTEEFGDATNTDYPGTIDDTWTNVGTATTNYSSSTRLNTYTWPADTVANTIIIKWDLTDISTSATVTEATLYLYQTDSDGDSSYDIGVHKITGVNPVINSLTWNTYDGTNSWTGGSDGGQSDIAAAEDTQSVNTTSNEYKTWDVTDMVSDWVATPANNYGMLVNSDDVASVDSCRYFASTEDSNAPYRPKLIVSYTTAAPGQASSPSPANSATDVSIDADLSWTAGSGATSHDVYFGTSSPGTFQGNQTATSFDTGTMSNDTTYYWRIDEVNTSGTTTGSVWSFTTVAAPEWTELTYDDFESGWGSYTDGGDDCSLYTGGTYAHQGSNAADIQDNSGVSSSFYYTSGVDVDAPGYTQIKVEFWYIPIGMESGEDFWLQYYDGSDWHTVQTWARGTDFSNGNPYNPTVYIDETSYTFPENMQIRFMCDASGNNDDVYIDEIRVSAK